MHPLMCVDARLFPTSMHKFAWIKNKNISYFQLDWFIESTRPSYSITFDSVVQGGGKYRP